MYFGPGLRLISDSSSLLTSSSQTLLSSACPWHKCHLLPPSILVFQSLTVETRRLLSIYHSTHNRGLKPSNAARSSSKSPVSSSVRAMSLSSTRPTDDPHSSQMEMNPTEEISTLPALNPQALREPPVSTGQRASEDVIVQYIVIRKDLVTSLNWPLGSVISQGCHAAVAAVWLHKDDPVTLQYCTPENLDSMHKVTLEVKGEAQLRTLAQLLENGGVIHKLWIEQPENYATCLATKPYFKSQIASYFKKIKLCK